LIAETYTLALVLLAIITSHKKKVTKEDQNWNARQIGLLQQTFTWYKIRHAGGQAHYYSRTGTLIGSLSLANEHYSPPTEWIMRKANKNKMAGVNA